MRWDEIFVHALGGNWQLKIKNADTNPKFKQPHSVFVNEVFAWMNMDNPRFKRLELNPITNRLCLDKFVPREVPPEKKCVLIRSISSADSLGP